jgi:hypothetical protein
MAFSVFSGIGDAREFDLLMHGVTYMKIDKGCPYLTGKFFLKHFAFAVFAREKSC